MAYFNNFPQVNYDVRGTGTTQRMTNITRRVRIRDYIKSNFVMFDVYDVKSGETPEYIANEFYGDPQLHWLVLLANDILDVYTDWPMSVSQFESYVYSKYTDINAVHHYEYRQDSGDSSVMIEYPNDSATTVPAGATAITNYEYEQSLQEQKRRIRLIQPRFVSQIQKEFKRLMNG